MLKILFVKYIPPDRPKLVPKLKMLIVYWNLVHFKYNDVDFNVKNDVEEIFTSC